MLSPAARTAALAVVLLLIGLVILLGSEIPCGAYPFCSVTTPGLWGGLAFVALALVSAVVRAFGRSTSAGGPPPVD